MRSQATQYVRALIQRINRRACFARAGVEWRFVRSCGRSWVRLGHDSGCDRY